MSPVVNDVGRPMDLWQNSTPFLGAASFCMTKIGDFRRQPQNENDHKNEDNIKHQGEPKIRLISIM